MGPSDSAQGTFTIHVSPPRLILCHGRPPTLAGRDPHRRPAGRGPLLLLRVLPAEDRGGGGPAAADAPRAGAAAAVVRLDHLRRRRDDPGADPRPRGRHPAVDADDADGPPVLRRPQPRTSCGPSSTGYRDEGVENILALRGDPPAELDLPPGDLAHADRAGRAGPGDRLVLDRRRRPSRGPPGLARPRRPTAGTWRPSSRPPTSPSPSSSSASTTTSASSTICRPSASTGRCCPGSCR